MSRRFANANDTSNRSARTFAPLSARTRPSPRGASPHPAGGTSRPSHRSARRIQDSKDNYTRFACIARECIVTRRADRSSFVVVVSHEPGSLFRLLGLFAALGVNLVKLESRPIPGSAFEFGFMLEIESVPGDSTFDAIAAQLPAYCESSRYLGSYQTHGTEVGR